MFQPPRVRRSNVYDSFWHHIQRRFLSIFIDFVIRKACAYTTFVKQDLEVYVTVSAMNRFIEALQNFSIVLSKKNLSKK